MTKQQFKEKQRQQRIDANGGAGARLGDFMQNPQSTYDNSGVWTFRNDIAKEILPEIRNRQRAWANMD